MTIVGQFSALDGSDRSWRLHIDSDVKRESRGCTLTTTSDLHVVMRPLGSTSSDEVSASEIVLYVTSKHSLSDRARLYLPHYDRVPLWHFIYISIFTRNTSQLDFNLCVVLFPFKIIQNLEIYLLLTIIYNAKLKSHPNRHLVPRELTITRSVHYRCCGSCSA